MSDFENGDVLVESVNGHWHRCKSPSAKGTFLLEWKDGLLLSIHVAAGKIDVLDKGPDGTYDWLADVSFNLSDGCVTTHLFSNSIDHVHFDDREHVVTNDLSKLKSVFVKLDMAKKHFP